MQKEYSNKKQPTLSLYTDEEIEGVSTSSSLAKSNTALHTEVNFSEVSSTSEDTYQLPSTSSKSIFLDLYEEDIANSEADVTVVKDNADLDKKKSMYKLGLSLLGEYTDSGNDSEEEVINLLGVKQDKSKKTVHMSNDKNSTAECGNSAKAVTSNENPNKLETGSSGVSNEALLSDDKISLTGGKEDDFDIHALLDDSLARSDKSKEDGQLSASDSSDSERSSDSKKDPKKSKEGKKDKSKKKDKKKKKKKRKKQKQQVERKEPSDKRGKKKFLQLCTCNYTCACFVCLFVCLFVFFFWFTYTTCSCTILLSF